MTVWSTELEAGSVIEAATEAGNAAVVEPVTVVAAVAQVVPEPVYVIGTVTCHESAAVSQAALSSALQALAVPVQALTHVAAAVTTYVTVLLLAVT